MAPTLYDTNADDTKPKSHLHINDEESGRLSGEEGQRADQ